MLLGVRDGRAVSVMGDPDHPVNEGRLCPKGLAEHQTIDVDGRLTTPTGRRGEPPRPWDDAIGTMVVGFRRAARTSTAPTRWRC